jgi:Na+-translocating ferredoxin:NAD+ oxidoreductase RnfC subunit
MITVGLQTEIAEKFNPTEIKDYLDVETIIFACFQLLDCLDCKQLVMVCPSKIQVDEVDQL